MNSKADMMSHKLRHVLTLNFIAVAALPVLAVGLLALRSMSNSLEKEIKEKNYIIAKSITGDLERYLNEPLRILKQIRELSKKRIVSENEMNEYLSSLVSQYPIFDVIRILDQEGVVTYVAPFDENVLGLDMSSQPYYRIALETDKPHWSHTVILSQTHQPTLTLTLPLKNGMVVGYLNLSELNRVIDKVKIGEKGYALIVDSNGTVIAHPNREFVAERTNVKDLHITQQGIAGNEGTYFYRFMDVERIGSVAVVPQTHWLVAVTQSVDEAFLPVKRIRNIVWTGIVVAILLAAFIALINLKRVLRPLLRLEKESRRIADGDYTYEPESIPYVEINNLAQSYKTMVDAIRARDQELRNSEAKYRQLVETSQELIWSVDSLGRLTYLNGNAAEHIYGYELNEMLGKHFTDFMTPEQAKKDVPVFEEMKAGRNLENYETVHIRKDGTPIIMRFSAVAMHNERGEFLGITGTASDITQSKRMEEERLNLERQVQHSQKLESLGVLAGGIAHDFNNLLMGILGNADLAMDVLPPVSSARGNITEIVKASKRAAELAKQMLAYSGKGRFIIEAISLNEFVEEMSDLLKVSISKKASLQYHFAQNLPFFEGDATQIRQVIMNLITNASEAIGDKSGVVALTTGEMYCDRNYLDNISKAFPSSLNELMPEGVYVYLEVSDTGCGMDAQTIQKVFDPFFTTKFTGRGLGLSAVLGIVRGHRGVMNVYSELGKGTTFKVLFPASQSALEAKAGRPKETAVDNDWQGSGTVLLVDDEEIIQTTGKEMLERIGFSVLTASDGEEALRILKQSDNGIDCILLDLTMPRMNGEECFREIRKIKNNVRVILSSGYNEQDVIQRFAGKGPAGFIQKPYQMDNLRMKLKEIFSRKLEGPS